MDGGARLRHLYVIGATGTGKSWLMRHLIAQDLAAGEGVTIIDPLGDLATAVLSLVSLERAPHLIYINPADLERPVGFNVLDRVAPDGRALVADEVVSAFIHIFGEIAIGDRTQQVLRNSLRALMDAPAGNLLCIPKLLTERNYRTRILDTVVDPVVASYWHNQFEQYDPAYRNQVIAPLLNKLDAALSAPALRNMLGQSRSTIDLKRVMHEGQVLVINLNKGALGAQNAYLLGALFVSAIGQAAFSRSLKPQHERRPFYLYADEFQDYAGQSFAGMLSQSRAMGLSLCLAHQYLAQLPDDIRHAVFGNAANVIALRGGADDAPHLARHLDLGYPDPNPRAIIELANFTAWARFLVRGSPSSAMRLDLYEPPAPRHQRPQSLIANSRAQFGRDRAAVEAAIGRFFRKK